MKELIDVFLNIREEDLLLPYFEDLKIEFKRSILYDDLSYINFCETIETYIREFRSEYCRKINMNNILLYGGF